ncbi:type VI secretion system baseplate subunit TssG [Marinospirillum sp.]|uniref:type VI secretion system baseplate subunit TssG n=1 Tax=Marinospirillum sp. TaxID=2183934 RepID=UPI0028700550|nr:type VI secretion system baseplate subunit TssG [Marinospirillum sp.]MDR9467439.1 type VI secretion system baseplate subunit TssG [Marinospirillum sp.]
MASQAESAIARISREAHSYSLLQLVRWIKAIDPGSQLRLRPNLQAGLAARQVDKAWKEEDLWFIQINLPGLYGRTSPLPAYITEILQDAEQSEQTAPRALLDLLNQRIYELLLSTLSKAYPAIQHIEWQEDHWQQLLTHLLGISAADQKKLPPASWLLQHFDLLTSSQRSAQGLAKLLTSYLQLPVAVEQCAPRRVLVDEASWSRLGRANHGLGTSAWLGSRITDRNGKIRVHVGPLSHAHFSRLVSDQATWQLLQTLVKIYLGVNLECQLVFVLEPPGQPLALGDNNWGYLGKNTWLLQDQQSERQDYLTACLTLIKR